VIWLLTQYFKLLSFYRQHCTNHKAPVFKLLRGRFWDCLPHRGDTLQRWGWKWHKGVSLAQFPLSPCQVWWGSDFNRRRGCQKRWVFTGSIAWTARRQYLIYSEANFEVFRPAGATRWTDGGEIWHGGGDRPWRRTAHMEEGTKGPLLHAKFHPRRCNG